MSRAHRTARLGGAPPRVALSRPRGRHRCGRRACRRDRAARARRNGEVQKGSDRRTQKLHERCAQPPRRDRAPEVLKSGGMSSTLYRDALGIVGAITPWNFPISMPHWLIVPALAVGNAVVFKPSEETPLTGAAYAECLAGALPRGSARSFTAATRPARRSSVRTSTWWRSPDRARRARERHPLWPRRGGLWARG